MRPFEGSFSASGASKVDLCLADCTINTYGFNLRQGQAETGHGPKQQMPFDGVFH
jgi:hypothetical protein